MDIKPKFNSETIKILLPVKRDIVIKKIVNDPKNLIPNGIYRVIRWEILLSLLHIIISLVVFIASSIIIFLYALIYKNAWITFILPIIFLLVALYRFLSAFLDYKSLKNAIKKYREDLKLNLTSQPPFIIKIYRNIFIRQVRHNWITFFLIFNGAIFTLMLWWLKDSSWWIFEFKKWIRSSFWNPDLMTIFLSIGLISTFIVHIFFAINRKQKIIEIESYVGETLVSAHEIEELKTRLNKAYRRFFIIYIMIILIIPFLAWSILKFFRKK